jgi:hypothetical protein
MPKLNPGYYKAYFSNVSMKRPSVAVKPVLDLFGDPDRSIRSAHAKHLAASKAIEERRDDKPAVKDP